MDPTDRTQSLWGTLYRYTVDPFVSFLLDLNAAERSTLAVLLLLTAGIAYSVGRRRAGRERGPRALGRWRFPTFQNHGEALVSRILRAHFPPPAYHLLNHVTLGMDAGTTQIDHILVSRFGVFVIETKHYKGWIFADAHRAKWTQVLFGAKFTFQNPLRQNYRHVLAVGRLLDFLPKDAIESLVVFTGTAEFKTDIPQGVTTVDDLVAYVRARDAEVMTPNRLQFCVGRIETARLAISRQTDLEHAEQIALRFGNSA